MSVENPLLHVLMHSAYKKYWHPNNLDTVHTCIVLVHHVLWNEPCHSFWVPAHTGMMLSNNNTLKKLDILHCGLQPEGLKEVINGIRVNNKLETLQLSWNPIDVKSAACLGKNTCTRMFHAHIHHLVMVGTPFKNFAGPSLLPHIKPHPSQHMYLNTYTCSIVYIKLKGSTTCSIGMKPT